MSEFIIITLCGLAILFFAFTLRIFYSFQQKTGKTRSRAISFTSEICFIGIFPIKTNQWNTVINAILYFEKCPTIEKLKLKCKKLLYYDRLRSTVSGTNPLKFHDKGDEIDIEWDLIETIDLESESDIVNAVDNINSKESVQPLEGKLLWKMFRLVTKNGKSAILIRVNHGIGDGISLVGTMTKLFEQENGEPYEASIPQSIGGAVNSSMQLSIASTCNFLKSLYGVFTIGMSAYDSDIKFNSPDKKNLVWGSNRKTILFPTLKLDLIKNIKNNAGNGFTVNDVLLSIVTGAIKNYCKTKNDSRLQNQLLCRALIPVAFPRSFEESNAASSALRNKFSFVSLELPINEVNSVDRLTKCNETTKNLKSSYIAFLQQWIQDNLFVLLPISLCRHIVYECFTRHSLIFSNLPGPSQKLLFCDEKLTGINVIYANFLSQILAISYSGDVSMTLTVDPCIVVDSEIFGQLYVQEFLDLAKHYNVSIKE